MQKCLIDGNWNSQFFRHTHNGSIDKINFSWTLIVHVLAHGDVKWMYARVSS